MTIVLIICGLVLLRALIRFLALAIPRRGVRCCLWSGLGLVMTVIDGIMVGYDKQFNNQSPSTVMDARSFNGMTIFFIGLVFFMIPWISWWLDSVLGSVRAATAPIPSVSEINQTLSAYYGRAATIEEIAAAQSIYVHQRNEAATQAALGIGAVFLLHDAANRAKGQ